MSAIGGRAAVARRYARALADLARAEGRLEPVGEELTRFERVLQDEGALANALTRPWVQPATKRAIVAGVTEQLGLSPLTRNFLALLAQRRRIAWLADILAAYRALADDAAGRARARVVSATPLTAVEQAVIRERLGRRIGRTVILETAVDPAILGGFVAEVGARRLDASLAGQLRALRQRLVHDSAGDAGGGPRGRA
ncbi:MAG: ATP synthase F1 subunit delta [Candidatus Rokuibacteriota bacterium]